MTDSGVIFDSNVWIAYFHTTDTDHTNALTVVEQHIGETIVLTEYVLLEIATLLKQKIGPKKTSTLLATLLQTTNIELLPSTNFFTTTLTEFLAKTDRHLSFVDVSLLVLSRDFTVVTFDKKLKKAITKSY